MIRILIPILIIAVAIGLFYGVTDPIINNPLAVAANGEVSGGIQALRAEKAKLEEALENARKLEKKIEELRLTYNSFSKEDQDRLNQFLPDNVDNVQLIVDINNIAKKYGMELKNVSIGSDKDKNKVAVAPRPGVLEQGAVTLGFSVTGSYGTFLAFLDQLSQSLRVVDITSVTVNTPDKGLYQYDVQLKTYWLK